MVSSLGASRNVPEEEWKLETHASGELVKNVRPGDQFALFVIGTDAAVPVLLSSAEVAEKLDGLASKPNDRVYDALLSAARRFDPPQFGDAIILIGHHEDFGREASPDDLLDLILKNKLRFHGIAFVDIPAKLPLGTDLNKPLSNGFGRSKLEISSAQRVGIFSDFVPHRA